MGGKKIRAWLYARLCEMLENDLPDLLARGDEKHDLTGRLDALRDELDDLQTQARNLVIKQAQAHTALSSIDDEQLETMGERMVIVRDLLAQSEREVRAQDTSGAIAAFHDLPDNLEEFWMWEGTAINQLLHRLIRQHRLVLKDGEIMETRDAPPHPMRKDKKRTYFGKYQKSFDN
jgi:hypothetical protein